ncbi:MAG: hypothetical protein JW966_00545 [Anaerolineae bacterium]|nr:hypothetical protein [Anaerolineae bacterium]
MTPELAILLGVLGAGTLGGARGLIGMLAQRAQRAHVIRVRTAWMRAAHVVHFGPVSALCLGSRPQTRYAPGTSGALGVTGDCLAFEGRRTSRCDVQLPASMIRWIGLGTVTLEAGRRRHAVRAMSVHAERPGGWVVYTFVLDDMHDAAISLNRVSGVPVRDAGTMCDDFGPARALRLRQDVYGDWYPQGEDVLYLAPDRLLFAWKDAIPLAAVERLDVLKRGGGRLAELIGSERIGSERFGRSKQLLRVAYQLPDGDQDVAGFVVDDAQAWADALVRQADIRPDVYAGRKKKDVR